MYSAFGANGERWKSGIATDFVREILIESHVCVMPILRFMMQDAGKKRVNRKVSAPQAMIETAVNCEFFTIRHQWF